MCQVKYRVTLSTDERAELKRTVVSSKSSKLVRKRSYLLMALDEWGDVGALPDAEAAKALGMKARTAQDVRRLFVLEGFEAALRGKPRVKPPVPSKIDGGMEARLVQMACSRPPEGYGRWSLRLLTDRFVELAYPGGVSHETVRGVLKKTSSSLGERSIS